MKMKLQFKLIKEIDSKDLKIKGFHTLSLKDQKKYLIELLSIEVFAEIDEIIEKGINSWTTQIT
jgi:hypothetical protein